MNSRMLIPACILLSACASPAFLGQPSHDVPVGGSTFRVYMQSGGSDVEVHRISAEPLPSRVLTLSKSLRAIEIATGCDVVNGSMSGDQAIQRAEVDCVLP